MSGSRVILIKMYSFTILILCIACFAQTVFAICPCMQGLMGVDLSHLATKQTTSPASYGVPIATATGAASSFASARNGVASGLAKGYGYASSNNAASGLAGGIRGGIGGIVNGAGSLGLGPSGLGLKGGLNALGGAVQGAGGLALGPSGLQGVGGLNVLGLVQGAGGIHL